MVVSPFDFGRTDTSCVRRAETAPTSQIVIILTQLEDRRNDEKRDFRREFGTGFGEDVKRRKQAEKPGKNGASAGRKTGKSEPTKNGSVSVGTRGRSAIGIWEAAASS